MLLRSEDVMIPRKRPETQKTPKVVVRPGSRRSPLEPEPAAKKPRTRGPGTAAPASASLFALCGCSRQRARGDGRPISREPWDALVPAGDD